MERGRARHWVRRKYPEWEEYGDTAESPALPLRGRICLGWTGYRCVWGGGVTSGQINPKYSIQYLSSCAAWSPERQVSPQLERYRELISTGVEIRTPASPIYTFITFWPPFLSLTCYCLLQTSVTIYLSSRTTSASPARQGVIFNFSQRPDAGRNNWTASYFMERALFFLLTDSKISHKYGETARQQQERAGFHHRAQPKATLPK